MTRISVVTVSYNAADTIAQTIESVLGQEGTFEREYLVIDGGSTDGTVEILRRYEDELAGWVSEPDEGIYDAMNKGIRRASGKWVGLLNSDDWYADGALAEVARLDGEHPEAGLLIGGLVRLSHDGQWGKVLPPPRGAFSMAEPNNHLSTFVRDDVYERLGGYDTSYPYHADRELLARAMADPEIEIVRTDRVLSYMRAGGVSAGSVGVLEAFRIQRKHTDLLTALRILAVKVIGRVRYALALALLPDRWAHALERWSWRGQHDIVDLSEARDGEGGP